MCFRQQTNLGMYFYQSQSHNPYFNIATEAYFLKNFDHDFFFLYINEPSIIVGKHQNTLAEINVHYAMKNQLKVVRRLSGGGTVFHDMGNINYCFIQKGAQGSLVDFKKYTQPILTTLQDLGVNAYLRGKSDLVIDDLKFSGNAEHVYRNKVLHHGTLLYNAALSQLNEAINSDWSKFFDKAVRSNRSHVTNIAAHLNESMSIDAFISKIKETVFKLNPDVKSFYLSELDELSIKQLVKEKFATWEWNFAYSPAYEFRKSFNFNTNAISVAFKVTKGVIHQSSIVVNQVQEPIIEQMMNGLIHDYNTMKVKLQELFEQQKFPFPFDLLLQNSF